MMMVLAARSLVACASLALLGACNDEVEDRQAELNIMKAARASPQEICDQQKKVTAAYLKRRDQHGYQSQSVAEGLDCQAAAMGIDYPSDGAAPEPDNFDLTPEEARALEDAQRNLAGRQ
jgi:hypothetical protein